MEKIEEYLYKEVFFIVDELFKNLKLNNIDVELEKNDLTEKETEAYINIYNEYRDKLVSLKENVLKEYGYINNFDYIFAIIIQNVVDKKKSENYN